MTFSAGTKTFENLKLKNCRSEITKNYAFPKTYLVYVYHLNIVHLLKTEGTNWYVGRGHIQRKQNMPGIYQNLNFNI